MGDFVVGGAGAEGLRGVWGLDLGLWLRDWDLRG